MQLTEPTYLWALLGLLIPLAIHLLSRKAGRVVQVGSIRHLVESNTRRFSSLRFNEYLLFALRALAIILFVLLLAGLSTSGKRSAPKWVLLETEPQRIRTLRASLDSLREAGYELRYWSEGFPLVETVNAYPGENPDYAYLLSELAKSGAEAIVYAKNHIDRFRGRQLPLPEKVSWIQLPEEKRQTTLQATRLSGDSVLILRGTTGPERTTFVRSIRSIPKEQTVLDDISVASDTVNIVAYSPLRVLFLTEETYRRPTAILQAAIRTLADFTNRKIIIEQADKRPDTLQNFDLVVNGLTEEQVADPQINIISIVDNLHGPFLQQVGGQSWEVSADLDRRSALRGNLLPALASVLFADRELDQKIRAWDQRTVDEQAFFSGSGSVVKAGTFQKQPQEEWLILGLIIVFVAERIFSFYRKA